MKIAFGAWLYSDTEPSGASRRAVGILRALARREDAASRDIIVLHRPDLDPAVWTDRDTAAAHSWHPMPLGMSAPQTWRRALAERRHLPKTLRTLGVDLVELGAMPVPPKIPCPVSLTIHDVRDLDGERRRRWPASWTRHVMRESIQRCAGIVVPSAFTRSRLHDLDLLAAATERPPRRQPPIVTVAAGGIDADAVRWRRDDGVEAHTILHVGHLEPRKELGLLIDALAILRCHLPDVRLRLIGADHGAGRELARSAQRRGVVDAVDFEGTVSEQQLRDAYDTCGVVAIPSRYEGFGLPALEALANGCPTAVSASSALPEVVGDCGQVVESQDPRAWAQALEALMRHSEFLNTAGVQAQLEHVRSMTWPRTAEQMLTHWGEIVDGSPHRDAR